MARARNIKPGFFMNEILAEIDPLGRILFAGLWTIADREGRLEDRPKKIKAEILPYDNCNIEKLLQSLSDKNFIIRYEVSGQKYIAIVNFSKHQNPHIKEPASSIPAPDLHRTNTVQEPDENGSSPADSLNLIPDSLNPIYTVFDHWNGKGIIKHKTLPDSKVKHITARFNEGHTVEAICEAIDNYDIVLKSSEYYWSHRWTLWDFLQRGMEKFLTDSDPFTTYRVRGGQAHEPTKKRNDPNDWDEDKFYTTAPET
jgi:hypothetical protein